MTESVRESRWDRRQGKEADAPGGQRERRQRGRIPLDLEITVPVALRSDRGVERGVARNISESGMLIQVRETIAIGSEVEVSIFGVSGSRDAPEAVVLIGEVRHHVAWQYEERGKMRMLRGIGVRFFDPAWEQTMTEGQPKTLH